ncbi:MFS transporter [Leadbetterella sp. DM7]|uniref:MFS transporter n=1 Tax=Leadbetterella sp. DM7 TaxID=3235085 RepID=UPI00349E94F0
MAISFNANLNTSDLRIHSTKVRVRIAVSSFYFFQGLCFASWASRIPDIKTALQLSDGAMGSILFALPAGQMCTMPVSGYLVGKYGSRNIMHFSLPLYSLAMVLLSLCTGAWQLAAALFLFGVTGNLCNISVNTQGVNAERMYNRPIMASFHGAWSLAGFTGALIGLLAGAMKLTPMYHFALISVISFIATYANVKYLVGDSAPKTATPEKKKFFSKPDPLILQLGIIGFFAMSCEGAMFDWSGVYFKDIVGAQGAWTSLGYACFMVMMATGRFVGDKIVAKTGKKRIMQLNGLLIAAGLLIAVLFPYISTAAFGFLLVGFGVSTNIPNVYSMVGQQKKMSASAALAAIASISYLGFLLGPPLIGYISEILNLRISYALIAVFGVMISVMVTRLKVIR